MKGILLFLLITSSMFAQNNELNKSVVKDLIFHETLRLKDSSIAENYGKLNFFSTITTADVELSNYENGEKLTWKGTKIVDSLKPGIYFVNVTAPNFVPVVDTIRIVNKEITFENIVLLRTDGSNWAKPFNPDEEALYNDESRVFEMCHFPQGIQTFKKLISENRKLLFPADSDLETKLAYVACIIYADGKVKLHQIIRLKDEKYKNILTLIEKMPNFYPAQLKAGVLKTIPCSIAL